MHSCTIYLEFMMNNFDKFSSLVKVKILVTQLCLTLGHTMEYSLPGSSVHGILHVRILEQVAIPSFMGSSRPRDRTQVSCKNLWQILYDMLEKRLIIYSKLSSRSILHTDILYLVLSFVVILDK